MVEGSTYFLELGVRLFVVGASVRMVLLRLYVVGLQAPVHNQPYSIDKSSETKGT